MELQLPESQERKQWMAVLAKAEFKQLKSLWEEIEDKPQFDVLRQPEVGLVMVRGRMGGSGQPFNLGEATVTRCSVRSDSGHTGHAYLLGRNGDHARYAAEVDALMQSETRREELNDQVILPLAQMHLQARDIERQKTAATKVDFFTMVRGEDE